MIEWIDITSNGKKPNTFTAISGGIKMTVTCADRINKGWIFKLSIFTDSSYKTFPLKVKTLEEAKAKAIEIAKAEIAKLVEDAKALDEKKVMTDTDVVKILEEIIRTTFELDYHLTLTEHHHLSDDLDIWGTDCIDLCEAVNKRFGTSLDASTDESIQYMRTVGTIAKRVLQEINQF